MTDRAELDRLARRAEAARKAHRNAENLPAAFVRPGDVERLFGEWLQACDEYAAAACRKDGAA